MPDSKKRTEIRNLMKQGLTTKQIVEVANISYDKAKTMCASIMREGNSKVLPPQPGDAVNYRAKQIASWPEGVNYDH